MFDMRATLLLLVSALYYQNTSSFRINNNIRSYPLVKNLSNKGRFFLKLSLLSAKSKEKEIEEQWDIDDKWANDINKDQADEVEEILGPLICQVHYSHMLFFVL